MDIQRLRNLTTGILHTQMGDVYSDIETITRGQPFFTHQLPNAVRALQPYLREHASDGRFWNDAWDREHIGEIEIPTMTEEQLAEFWTRYMAFPNPLTLIGSESATSED